MKRKYCGAGFLAAAALALLIFASLPAAALPLMPSNTRGAADDCNDFQSANLNLYDLTYIYRIPVVFHVITMVDGTTGALTDQQIIDQIQVLNEDFRALPTTLGANGYDTKIQFSLVRITRSSNNAWFLDTDTAENEYKAALGWDQNRFLNIYSNNAEGYEGQALSPVVYAGDVRDGVTLAWDLVGGRDQADTDPASRNQGRTAVHYVARYLGLKETYSEFCPEAGETGYNSGDLVADTNPHNVVGSGCPDPAVESCTGEGVEPIHNYMNTTSDDCRDRFTQEQAQRMYCTLVNYRPGLYKPEYYGLPILNGPMMPLLSFP